MQSFKQLPANARRALARRELQRRAGRAGANDDPELAALREQLEVAIPALILPVIIVGGVRFDLLHETELKLFGLEPDSAEAKALLG